MSAMRRLGCICATSNIFLDLLRWVSRSGSFSNPDLFERKQNHEEVPRNKTRRKRGNGNDEKRKRTEDSGNEKLQRAVRKSHYRGTMRSYTIIIKGVELGVLAERECWQNENDGREELLAEGLIW